MQPSFTWLEVLLLVGAAHSVLMAVTLLNIRRGNRLANRIFALVLFVFAATISLHTLAASEYIVAYPHLAKIEPPLVFLVGPLFYFYVVAMIEGQVGFRKKQLWHLVPFLTCVAVLAPFYFASHEAKVAHILSDHQQDCAHCLILYWAAVAHILAYVMAITRRLWRSKTSIGTSQMTWLRTLLFAMAINWCLALVLQLASPNIQGGDYVWLLVSLNIYLVGYTGLRRPEVFSGAVASARDPLQQKKYERSTLTEEKADEYQRKLEQFMASEKPYLDGDLTLPALAKKLAITTHHLSQIINERLQQNFFEFVNTHRVEEAKRRIEVPENQHINLAGIALDVGFNSISSFNTAFKKHTGITPSEFRERGNEG
jgi:AraC-like DNA-binding protein